MTALRVMICSLLALACLMRPAMAQQAAVGIGVGLAPQNGVLVVTLVLPGGPAEKAGLTPGARILEIGQDGAMMIPASAMPPEMFVRLLSGPPGSRVTVKSSAAEGPARTDTFVRAAISAPAPDPLAAWGEAPGATASAVDPELPQWAVPRIAPMRVQGSYLVLLPPNYDPAVAYPLVVLLHGSGDNEQAFGKVVQRLGRDGVIYLALRAPLPDMGAAVRLGRPSFTAALFDRPREAPEQAVARRDYVDWVFDAVADARKAYRTDGGKILLYGFSQGGGIAITAAAARPDQVRSVFSQAGAPVWDGVMTPQSLAGLKAAGVQFQIGHGAEDTTVPVAVSQDLAAKLTAMGIVNELRISAGPHTITPEQGAWGKAWVDTVRRR